MSIIFQIYTRDHQTRNPIEFLMNQFEYVIHIVMNVWMFLFLNARLILSYPTSIQLF